MIQSAIAADPTHADDATLLVKIAAQAVPEVSSSCNQGPVEKYTRNEWGRCKTTLKTSEEDVKLHSKRVENSDREHE